YGAHLFYGFPLGRVCQEPERQTYAAMPFWRTERGWITLFLIAATTEWMIVAWGPPLWRPVPAAATVQVGPAALSPGWSDVPVGTEVALVNDLPRPAALRWRAPGKERSLGDELLLQPGERRSIVVAEPGIHQMGLPGS